MQQQTNQNKENYQQQNRQYQQSYQDMYKTAQYSDNSYYTMHVEKRNSDRLAVASLIIGILSLLGICCFGGLIGSVGAVFGILAIRDYYCNKRTAAIIGLVTSASTFIITIIVICVGIMHKPIMPDVRNLNYYDAKTQIEEVCYSEVDFLMAEEYSDTVEKGLVIRTNPDIDMEINTDEAVTIYISKGPKIVMPDVIGMDKEQAKQVIEAIGFEAYIIEDYSEADIGIVIDTEYVAGYELNDTSGSITIIVSKGTKEQEEQRLKEAKEKEIQKLKESAQNVSYDDLMRYPTTYEETPIKLTVKVTKLEAESFLGIQYDTSIWATYEGETLILEDDREIQEPALLEGDTVTIYGYGNGKSTIDITQKEYQGSLVFGFSYDKTVDSYEVPSIRVQYVEF
ncbi:MAG: PASTA domain-containing protein [Lachnospiraceae bacterium]|nr:PASTA domain-containing protein [Lachnospiraceae bacterium]